mmetsp:Transcript_76354/g.221715  ORF Transcript_76354/g.221715 Transcript_76354/m.221715 type:complete len:112 (+) Transcript_76354:75-410(+)
MAMHSSMYNDVLKPTWPGSESSSGDEYQEDILDVSKLREFELTSKPEATQKTYQIVAERSFERGQSGQIGNFSPFGVNVGPPMIPSSCMGELQNSSGAAAVVTEAGHSPLA